jgi:hypothetical protein
MSLKCFECGCDLRDGVRWSHDAWPFKGRSCDDCHVIVLQERFNRLE